MWRYANYARATAQSFACWSVVLEKIAQSWWDSNPLPLDYLPSALTTELRGCDTFQTMMWDTGSSRAQINYWSTVPSCFCFQAICDGPTSLRRGDSRRPSSPGRTRTHCTHPADPGTTTSLLQTVRDPDRLGWTQRQTARPHPGRDRS